MATSPLQQTYKVVSISEAGPDNVGVNLVQYDTEAPAPGPGVPAPFSTTWVLIVEKSRATEFLPGETYTVTFKKTT